MRPNTKPRTGTSSLVAGVGIVEDAAKDGYPRWRVRASAPNEGKQERMTWSPARYGLAAAVRNACEWRAQRVPAGPPAADLERATWDALPADLLERLKDAGVDTHPPSGGAVR